MTLAVAGRLLYLTIKRLNRIDNDVKLLELIISSETAKNGRISLLFGDLEEQGEKGLCHPRFKADIVIDGKAELILGDNLLLGDSAILTVIGRKRCFPECAQFTSDMPCYLPSAVVFANVKNSGTVRLGDTVRVLYE